MEVALGAITIATAVKDIVELGQKIHESFAKVSKNLRNAKRAAEKIKSMVDKIGAFCDGHKDVLESENMKDFREALADLHHQFRKFEASILPLLPKPDRWKLGPFIRGWWNNNKIEEHILGLQSDVIEVIQQHMMGSTMRIELKQETNHQDTIQGLTEVRNEVTQGLEIVRKEVSAIRVTSTSVLHDSGLSYGMSDNEFSHNITAFAQSSLSTSVPMLRSPDMITGEVATTVYIKVQIAGIAVLLENVSAMPVSIPNDATKFAMSPFINAESMSSMHLRHNIVRELTTIHDLLDIGQHVISVPNITMLNNLSVDLGILNMPQEAMLVCDWTITLARTLAETCSGTYPDVDAALAFYLHNQSIGYYSSGNVAQSLQSIIEAHVISQNLVVQQSGQPTFQVLHSTILLWYASFLDSQQSLQMYLEAIQILEGMFNVQAFTVKPGNIIEGVVQPSSSFLDALLSAALPKRAIVQYIDTLKFLGTWLYKNNQHSSALDLWLLAIAVHQKLVSTYGSVWMPQLAKTLFSLLQNDTANYMQAEQRLSMARESVQLLYELAGKNPPYYARRLVKTLWVKAITLQDLGQDTEAIVIWKESSDLAGKIVQDSVLQAQALGKLSTLFRHLKRYGDAVQTRTQEISTNYGDVETRALRYFHLSKDLQNIHSYKKSVEAAKKAVDLYKHLAMKNPEKWMCHFYLSVAHLSHCLACVGDYPGALIIYKESVSICHNLVGNINIIVALSMNIFGNYIDGLFIFQKIACQLQSGNLNECLEVISTGVQCLSNILEAYPHPEFVFSVLYMAKVSHAIVKLSCGDIQDALQDIDSELDKWNSRLAGATPNKIYANLHALMSLVKIDALNAQGLTKEALWTAQILYNILKPFATTSSLCFDHMLTLLDKIALLQSNLSNSRDALQTAKKALQLAQDSMLQSNRIDGLILSLHAVAHTALLCQDYNCAVKAGQEGLEILNSPECTEPQAFMHPSILFILSSAEANLGNYRTAEKYTLLAIDKLTGLMETTGIPPEFLYVKMYRNFIDIHLATGNLKQAQKICKEQHVHFTKRIEKRAGEYRELAPVLRMLGILSCSEGHCEKGAAAAKELTHIINTLGTVLPSLQEEVKIQLRLQVQVPILKVLNDMHKKLDCGHQAEIDSLFEN